MIQVLCKKLLKILQCAYNTSLCCIRETIDFSVDGALQERKENSFSEIDALSYDQIWRGIFGAMQSYVDIKNVLIFGFRLTIIVAK